MYGVFLGPFFMKKISDKRRIVLAGRQKDTYILHMLYQEIWEERGPYSEVSDTYLGKSPLSTFFHHILPKNKYPKLIMNKDNIIIMTAQEHEKVEQDPFFYEKINQKRKELLNGT